MTAEVSNRAADFDANAELLRLAPLIVSLSKRWSGGVYDVDEVQSAYLDVLKRFAERRRETPETAVLRAVTRGCQQRRKAKLRELKRRDYTPIELVPVPAGGSPDRLKAREMVEQLSFWMPEAALAALTLRRVEKLPWVDIADRLGLPPWRARQLVKEALKKARELWM